MNTPSFRLRRIYVDGPYLYAISKAWAGQLPQDREDTEDLHVLDKYSGRLLLTLPGNRAHSAHAVGAGYVLTSENAQGELHNLWGTADSSVRGRSQRSRAQYYARADWRSVNLPHTRGAHAG